MDVKCFLIEPTAQIRRSLRRYGSSSEAKCPGPHGYHDAMAFLDTVDHPGDLIRGDDPWPRDDSRRPSACACGYRFTADDPWQLFVDRIYRRGDTGEEYPLRDAPPGAMWNAKWCDHAHYKGPDGLSLYVRLPNGRDWHIDGRANNCTMPEEWTHRCWIRHGTPPLLTVDKNGNTCQAGAGSILSGDWHGFLRNGALVTA